MRTSTAHSRVQLTWTGQNPTASLPKIDENDVRRIADGCVMAGEVEAAGLSVDTKDGDVVSSLIAAVEELTAGDELEASRVISARPFFCDTCQDAGWAHREYRDAVMQPVAGIDKPAVTRNQDFGAEIACR